MPDGQARRSKRERARRRRVRPTTSAHTSGLGTPRLLNCLRRRTHSPIVRYFAWKPKRHEAPRIQASARREGGCLGQTALVVPILVALVSGIVVMGFGWQDKMTIETAGRAGARTASNLGADPQADYNTLQTVLSGMSNIPSGNIQRVGCNADSTNTVPAASTTGSTGVSGTCNVYTSSSFSLTSSSFGSCSSGPDH